MKYVVIDSTIPINVVGMKSYMNSLFDPTCVPIGGYDQQT